VTCFSAYSQSLWTKTATHHTTSHKDMELSSTCTLVSSKWTPIVHYTAHTSAALTTSTCHFWAINIEQFALMRRIICQYIQAFDLYRNWSNEAYIPPPSRLYSPTLLDLEYTELLTPTCLIGTLWLFWVAFLPLHWIVDYSSLGNQLWFVQFEFLTLA